MSKTPITDKSAFIIYEGVEHRGERVVPAEVCAKLEEAYEGMKTLSIALAKELKETRNKN